VGGIGSYAGITTSDQFGKNSKIRANFSNVLLKRSMQATTSSGNFLLENTKAGGTA
jgi:hypothetical protein